MSNTEKVEREGQYLKGHFEKASILPDVILKGELGFFFSSHKWLFQKYNKPKSEKEFSYKEHRAG